MKLTKEDLEFISKAQQAEIDEWMRKVVNTELKVQDLEYLLKIREEEHLRQISKLGEFLDEYIGQVFDGIELLLRDTTAEAAPVRFKIREFRVSIEKQLRKIRQLF